MGLEGCGAVKRELWLSELAAPGRDGGQVT